MSTPDVRQEMYGETMDYTGMTMWTPTQGLNISISNFNSSAYTVSGDTVTLRLCGVFGTLLSDAGNTAELDDLDLPAQVGSTYSASLEFTHRDDSVVSNGTASIDPAVNASRVVLTPPTPLDNDTLYTVKGTLTYTKA